MAEDAAAPSTDDLEGARRLRAAYDTVRGEISKVIVGQDAVVEQLLVCIFARGHALLVGVPGLAKTLLVSTLSRTLSLSFSRIQFTPDLMPADITGTEVIQEDRASGSRELKFLRGPVFANVVLADEINRTPPKTQAALLEAMQEHQVTAGGRKHPLPEPFFVLATQNPIEQEGTYPLPEAQLDRFMFLVRVEYPSAEEEMEIVRRHASAAPSDLKVALTGEEILDLQRVVARVPVADAVLEYALSLTRRSRVNSPEAPDFVRDWVSWGAGPRASQFLVMAGRARALLRGRTHVAAEDIRAVAHPVLRHRILTNFSAEAEGVTSDLVVSRLLETVGGPPPPPPPARARPRYLDPKVLNRVSRLDLRARLIVEGFVAGRHRSPSRGFSVEFAEHREYAPGDDLRYLDWKVFGKSDRLYVKQYEEETNLVATICVDGSESMRYESPTKDGMSKRDYAATVAASLAYLVLHQQDAAGLVLFDDEVRQAIPAGSQPIHLQRMLNALDGFRGGPRTDLGTALGGVAETIRRRGLVVVVSDLLDESARVLAGLRRLRSRRHDVVVFQVLDKDETAFPFDRMTRFEASEQPDSELLCDPRALRASYLESLTEFQRDLRAGCLAERIDFVPLDTGTPLDVALSGYLARRAASVRG